MKRDCQAIGGMLEEEDGRVNSVVERERRVAERERELTSLKQKLNIENDKVKVAEQSNERWYQQLKLRQEEMDSELKDRVLKITEAQKHEYENQTE
jgi:hypothetical protein